MEKDADKIIRFERQIFLNYLEDDIKFKIVNEEIFNKNVNRKTAKTSIKKFNKKDIYRLADKKEVFYNEQKIIVGEIWYEDKFAVFCLNKNIFEV